MSKYYKTKNSELASSVIASGQPLVSIEREEGIQFLFENSETLEFIVSRYWLRNLPLDAQMILKEYRHLIELINQIEQ